MKIYLYLGQKMIRRVFFEELARGQSFKGLSFDNFEEAANFFEQDGVALLIIDEDFNELDKLKDVTLPIWYIGEKHINYKNVQKTLKNPLKSLEIKEFLVEYFFQV